MKKIKPDPISALVMKLSQRSINCGLTDDILEYFDLSSADELYIKCKEICDWYEEIFLNREFIFSNYIKNHIEKSDEKHLVIILSAGKSLCSLRILKNFDKKVEKVIEIDNSGMDDKKALYDTQFPEFSNKIKCITADVRSSSILKFINNLLHEFYDEHPCLIVIKDLTYFLSKDQIANLIHSLKSNKKNNTIMLEYLLPIDELKSDRKNIPQNIFDTIKHYCHLPQITHLDTGYLSDLIYNNGGDLLNITSMAEIEKMRTGVNKYFHSPDEGWIECSAWRI